MPRPTGFSRTASIALVALLLAPAAWAQVPEGAQDSVDLVLGPRYQAGGLRSFFWGDHYRDAWTTPLRLPRLDVDRFAGGLTPERTAGGTQTTSLLLRGRDDRVYQFRLIDKDPTRGLPEPSRREPMVEFLQDQVSSLHPLGVLVVDELETAAGVLHPPPRPYVLADDDRLGPFREQFGGRAGILVERLDDGEGDGFEGFDEILGTEAMLAQAARGDPVDDRALLTARLVDLLVGDWNRHPGQWVWGRSGESGAWRPIALDRDHAFSRRDGIVPSGAHYMVRGFVGFNDRYPNIYDLHHMAREVDRRLLAGLERPAWDSVVVTLQNRLSDAVIDDAVRRLPGPLYALDGESLSHALRQRRDDLREASSELYDLLAKVVEVHLTDRPDVVTVAGLAGGLLSVSSRTRDTPVASFRRVFDPIETEEIRIFVGDGDDLVHVEADEDYLVTDRRGRRALPQPVIRIVGGGGDDEILYETDAIRSIFYDAQGANRVSGSATAQGIRDRPYPRDATRSSELDIDRPVQWGNWAAPDGMLDFSSDFGLFVGVGATSFDYGFRRDPYERRIRLIGGLSTQGHFHIEYEADFRHEASARHVTLELTASELDVVNFFGFGNETRRFVTSDSADARRRALSIQPRLGNQVGRYLDVGVGVALQLSRTVAATNPFINVLVEDADGDFEAVSGSDGFVQVGAFADVRFDNRDSGTRPTGGFLLEGRAAVYPGVFDVGEEYGSLEVSGSTYITGDTWPMRPTLALRAGARKILGEFPFFDAAIVGGSRTLRGFDSDRFAGDAALFGGAEIRLEAFQPRILFLGTVGLIGFVDVGRVYYDGESPGGWHTGYGGGIWITPLGVATSLSAVLAHSEETTRFYVYFGMPF